MNLSIEPETGAPILAAATARPTGRRRPLALAVVAAAALIAATVAAVGASPASDVTPTLLARGSYDAFKVSSHPDAGLFKAEAKRPIDVVVRRHEYTPGGSTGWHAHPYPVLITVISGEVTFYDYNDPTCTPTVVRAGEGYVDSGHGHLGRNETGQPAVDVSVIMAPVGAVFRDELTAPNPHCGF